MPAGTEMRDAWQVLMHRHLSSIRWLAQAMQIVQSRGSTLPRIWVRSPALPAGNGGPFQPSAGTRVWVDRAP